MKAKRLFLLSPLRLLMLILFPMVARAVPFAYISNYLDDTVSVIDTATNTVVGTLPVGHHPWGVVVNPTGTRVYVSLGYGDIGVYGSVAIIDTTTTPNTVMPAVSVGSEPYGIAINPQGTRVYVGNDGHGSGNTVSVINVSGDSNVVIGTITVGFGPGGLAVNPAGTRLYVVNNPESTLSVVDTTNNANSVVATVSLNGSRGASGVVFNQAGTVAYITGPDSGLVHVLDTTTNPPSVVAEVSVGGRPGAVALNPTNGRLYVPNSSGNTVSVIDTKTTPPSILDPVTVGAAGPFGVAVNPTGTRVYVTGGPDTVSVIDTTTTPNAVVNVKVGNEPIAFGQFIATGSGSERPTGLAANVGTHTVYLHWNSPASQVDGYNVEVYQFELNNAVPVHLGTLFAKDPSATISKLPGDTFVANGSLYGFTVAAVVGTTQSASSDEVFARAGEFAVSQPPPHRDDTNTILFLHGICPPLGNTDASTWDTTKHFFSGSLGWKFGGTLSYSPFDDPTNSQPIVSPGFDATGDFFTVTFGSCDADYTLGLGRPGILHQADELQGFIKNLSPAGSSRKFSIVAHSMGGMSARSYVADNQVEATQKVTEFITYGTPHWGTPLADYDYSPGAQDLAFDCPKIGGSFQLDYSENSFLDPLRKIVLPDNIRYFAIRGNSVNFSAFELRLPLNPSDCFSFRWDGVIPIESADFNGRSNPPIQGQQFPSSAPQGQMSITPRLAGLLTTERDHSNETNDFSAILCALDTNCAIVEVKSPVDVEVVAPNGQTMAKDLAAMPGASYFNIIEEDGHDTAKIIIPFPQGGQYTIRATPRPGILPTDTFTITLTQNGVTTTIADHMQIQNIPPDGFHPHVNSRPFANAGSDQIVECAGRNGTSVTLNGSASGDQDGDRLTYAWTDSLGNAIGNAAIVTVLTPMGTQTYNLTVTDPSGLSAKAQTHISVRDTTPPVLKVTVSPSMLRLPKKKFVPISANIQVSDVCDPNPIVTLVSITSNDPDDDLADIQGAVLGTDDRAFLLRARHADKGMQRIYTITYRATDHSGNATTATAVVYVPHDREDKRDDD